ncbi:transcriptional antiterminator RfaH [Rhizobiales bacterium GAS191]|nr:transcriptional antiterminator RfaH [Rhizobiales bacterium GAS191]
MGYWSVAQLQPHRTQVAMHFLELNGFEPYVPRIRTTARKNGHDGSTWLFPGYGFIHIEMQWRAAARCPGVLKLILIDGRPARLAGKIIDALRAREGASGVIELPTRAEFMRGDSVRILRGPLRDQTGVFEDMLPKERVSVLLAILGSPRSLILPRRHIARIPGQSIGQE